MEDDIDAVIDATEFLLEELQANDEVAYAEVGGVRRRQTDAVATAETVRSAADVESTGVWFRAFANGSADYRFSSSLDRSHLEDLIERSVRAGRVLKQDLPASYDRGSMHRGIHPGWATDSGALTERDADAKAGVVRDALRDGTDGFAVDRARATYRDEHALSMLSTTTGTTEQQTIDRAWATLVVEPTGAPKVQRHVGETTGAAFLESLSEEVRDLTATSRDAAAVPTGAVDPGEVDVAFSPRAAGELFHRLSHYLEIDVRYFGSSPLTVGDVIAPSLLDIDDVVKPGSWTAFAYDAEGRPATPTTLVSDGVVRNAMYDTVAAIEEEAFPAGNVVPSLGFEEPPRVHARHLDVAPGRASLDELREGADLYVEAVGEPVFANEATRTKRESMMPPVVLYAKDIREDTPSDYADEADQQALHVPVTLGNTTGGDGREGLVTDVLLEVSLPDFQSLSALTSVRETVTGTCLKHHSTLPYAVTAPGARMTCRVLPQ